MKTGCPWEHLPQELGCGCGMTCWRRLRNWHVAGVWKKTWKLLLDELGDDERVRLVINMAATADRLAAKLAAPWAGCESLTITRRDAVARYADRLPEVTARIWPGVRL